MKCLAQIISWLALAATAALPCLFFADLARLSSVQAGMLLTTLLWFITAPVWMEHDVGG